MDEELKEAWNIAVRLLSRREYSRHEIRLKLGQRGYATELIDKVLEQLITNGYQSDARFAEHYTRFRAGKGYGPKRIRLELQEKGVDAGLIDDALQEAGVDWLARVAEVHSKKFKGQSADSWEEKSRQTRFLDYRGFTPEQIASCLQHDPDYD
jgi:regulatory protein